MLTETSLGSIPNLQSVALAPLTDQDVTATAHLAFALATEMDDIPAAISAALCYRGRVGPQERPGLHEEADFRVVADAVDVMLKFMRDNTPRDEAPHYSATMARCERFLGRG